MPIIIFFIWHFILHTKIRTGYNLFTLKTAKTKGIYKTKKLYRLFSTGNQIKVIEVDYTLKIAGSSLNKKLNPWFVTGITDGDGSLYIILRKDPTCRFYYSIGLEYKVVAEVNPFNLKLLKQIQYFFGGVGTISIDKNTYQYVIRNRNHLKKVLDHFNNYPLQTTKYLHFTLWSKGMALLILFFPSRLNEQCNYSTIAAPRHPVNRNVIRFSRCFCPSLISNKFKTTRFYSASTARAVVKPSSEQGNSPCLDPRFVTGFTDGEGCFSVSVIEDPRQKIGWRVRPRFQIKLHKRDLPVLVEIQKSLGGGKIYGNGANAVLLQLDSLGELESKAWSILKNLD